MASNRPNNYLTFYRFAKKHTDARMVGYKAVLEWIPICYEILGRSDFHSLAELKKSDRHHCINTIANAIEGDIALLDDSSDDDLYNTISYYAIMFSNEDDYNLIRLMYNA